MRAKFEGRGEGLVLTLVVTETELEHLGRLSAGIPLSIGVEGDGRDVATAVGKAVEHQTNLARVQFEVERG